MEINARFSVFSESNEVLDNSSGERVRLEPRLIKLLCLLAENSNKVVSRERIIKEVWDDYPGAGEGLNQAISFLRKVLKDEDKQLIRTLPKTGYSLNVSLPAEIPAASKSNRQRYWYFAATALVMLTIALLGLQRKTDPARPAAVQASTPVKKDTVPIKKAIPVRSKVAKIVKRPLADTAWLRQHQQNIARVKRDSAHQAETLRQNAIWNSDSAKRVRAERSRLGREAKTRDSLHQAGTLRNLRP